MNLNAITIGLRTTLPGEYSPAASFDFLFGGSALDSRITFTRASNATYFDSTGTLQTAGSGVARSNAYQDHDPSTLAPLGFLIEEQRTNSIRNNTMVGAVAGTPGTLPTNWNKVDAGDIAINVIGTGTENGIAYIDIRFVGTTASTNAGVRFESTTQIVAAQNQIWASSIFIRTVAGSTANISAVNSIIFEREAAGTFIGSTDTTITSSLGAANIAINRQASTRTLGSALAARVQSGIGINFSSGVAIDITLRIGLPQLELGAFATSPILTTSAAATRLADVASITGTNFSSFWNAVEGTIVAKFSVAADATSKAIVTVSDATANERLIINTNSARAGTSFRVVDGGVEQCDISRVTAYSAGQQLNVAVAYKVNDFAISFNGSAVGTDASGTIPTVTQMNIGGSFSGVPANVHIQSIADYSKRLPNATLQSLAV
jgi:hypothetical protein